MFVDKDSENCGEESCGSNDTVDWRGDFNLTLYGPNSFFRRFSDIT